MCKSQFAILLFRVSRGKGPSVYGKNWVSLIRVDWNDIFCSEKSTIDYVLSRHQSVFSDELGTFTGPPVNIHLDDKVTPAFYKARSVPYYMRLQIDRKPCSGV